MLATPTPTRPDEAAKIAERKVSISSVLENPNLPSPPALVLQIVEKASQPACNPDEVLALLSKDSALCCQVLKTVNSGLFGLSKSVGSLKQAILLLGVRPLRSLVLSLALPAIRIPDKDDLVMKYWQESVAGAVIARELVRELRRPEPEDDLIAGLLRDLGVLVLREAFGQEYRGLWRLHASAWAAQQCDLERETFGVDHAEISAAILESWNLPSDVHQPIRFHHEPATYTDGTEPLKQRAWLLCFASKVATLHASSTSSVSELVQFAQKHFGMTQAALIKFLASVTPAIQEFATLLKIDIGKCPNYSGIIANACQELVRLSLEPRESSNSIGSQARTHATRTGETSTIADPTRTLPDFDLACVDQIPTGGAWLNGYEIREVLGSGAMGVVFKAYDPSLDRFAAVKMMKPERVVMSEARDWFKREARASAAIQHENIITIYLVSEMNGLPYLVMEFLSGVSLQDRVDKEGPLPIADVISFGRQIARGLNAAQARRVIHRDIKPANILLGREPGTVKITDFGLASVLDGSPKVQDGVWVGTPQYMAPEQFHSANVDHRADLFSLGSLLFTLCAGKPPFSGPTLAGLMQNVRNIVPPSLRSLRPETPVWLANLVAKLQAKQPAARCQSALEVVQIFDQQA